MSAGTKVLGALMIGGLVVGGIAFATEGPSGAGRDEPELRKVVLVGSVKRGHAVVQYIAGEGWKHDEFGHSKSNETAGWTKPVHVPPKTEVRVIVVADDPTTARCGIRAAGVPARAPAVTPLSLSTSTVECTAVVP